MKYIQKCTVVLGLILMFGLVTLTPMGVFANTPKTTTNTNVSNTGPEEGFIPFFGTEAENKNDKQYDIFDSENTKVNDKTGKSAGWTQGMSDISGKESIGVNLEGVKEVRSKTEKFVTIISALIFGFSVIMITFAGFKYATSEGDERVTRQAKMQIIYAGIGIGVSVMNLLIIKMFEEIISLG